MLNVSDMGSAKDQGFKSFASISYCTLLGPSVYSILHKQ